MKSPKEKWKDRKRTGSNSVSPDSLISGAGEKVFTDLLPHEELYLIRVKHNLTIEQVAKKIGLKWDRLERIENGMAKCPPLSQFSDLPRLTSLDRRQQYIVLRRRARLTREQLGEMIGVSDKVVLMGETTNRGFPAQLETHWKGQYVRLKRD